MKNYNLSFGVINIIKENLAEVIVNDGVEMDEIMVDEYHDFILSNLAEPTLLLINKKNSYSYTFPAQKAIISLKKVKAAAVIVSSVGGMMSTETLMNLNENNCWKINLFQKRDEALLWLNSLEF
ncbi:hypothetical protein ACFSKN_00570 [Mariniflexile gromovii]|uniref:SpoIIAA-like protein n=1 Tax=Mariniflexile gromovii TaxID=362523 RepID=A0ABS4BS17_9FLAO|nr:hypothetical protein [Mariniflexile gromovii]MBP0903368.1 hypothetical protein [Mariniflexile gromovii]